MHALRHTDALERFAENLSPDQRERLTAVLEPVREQFEADVRALTEAEQDSKELKSAKRDVLVEQIVGGVKLPWLVPGEDGSAPVMDATTRSLVKKAIDAVYKDLVRRKIAVEKRRPDGRATEEIRPIVCEVSVSPRTHG